MKGNDKDRFTKQRHVATEDINRLVASIDLVRAFEEQGAVVERAGALHKCNCLWHSETSPSCCIYPAEDRAPPHYHCHACGAHGTVIDLLEDKAGLTFEQILVRLAERAGWWPEGLTKDGFKKAPPKTSGSDQRAEWTPIVPVPDKIVAEWMKPEQFKTYKSGRLPVRMHVYRNAAGKVLGLINRYLTPGDPEKNIKPGKEPLPWTFCENSITHQSEWRCRRWESPLPLYGLDRLAAAPPDAPVFVFEGEGKADDTQARSLLPGPCLSWCGGCKAVKKNDWSPLAGRTVYILPDTDQAGLDAQTTVAGILHGLGCKVHCVRTIDYADLLGTQRQTLVEAAKAQASRWGEDLDKWIFTVADGSDMPAGWDLGDAPAEWTAATVRPLIDRALPVLDAPAAISAAPTDESLEKHCAAIPLHAVGYAQRLIARFGADLRYDFSRQHWITWTGTHWSPDRDGAAMRAAIATAEALRGEVKHRPPHVHPDLYAERYYTLIGRTARLNMLDDSRALPGVTIRDKRDFDHDPYLLNTPSGTYDLRTFARRPARREDLGLAITTCAPAASDAPLHPILDKVLASLTGGSAPIMHYLQTALGASLVGGNRSQHLYVLIAPGGCGKTLLLEGLHAILGQDYSAAVSQTTLLPSSQDKIRSDIARLDGPRLVYCDEVKDGIFLDEWLIKWLTGGASIVARFLNENEIEFRPRCTPWIIGNGLPRVRGDDSGIQRRLVLIDLRHHARPPADRDPALMESMRDPTQVGPSLLAWAMEGARRYLAAGCRIVAPPEIAQPTADYLVQNDPHASFLADQLRFDSDREISQADLRRAYESWCHDEGLEPLMGQRMGERLRQRGATVGTSWIQVKHDDGSYRNRKVKIWKGVGLVRTTDPEAADPAQPTIPWNRGTDGTEESLRSGLSPENSPRVRARIEEAVHTAGAHARAQCDSPSLTSHEERQGSIGSKVPTDLDIHPDDLARF